MHQKNSKDSKYVLIFSLASVVAKYVVIKKISLHESCKTYLGPMLPPGANVIKLYSNLLPF